MLIREKKEQAEHQTLSKYAAKSAESKGRDVPEEACEIRTCFQRDRDRILHSKSFRRLKHKTQVFLAPTGDHYRTRLTHTLEVSQIARTIASSLFLNEDLTEAIALGHDLGHTPFGHAGERALNTRIPFSHSRQSLRVVEMLEDDGKGLNLTWEVRDGIVNHSMSKLASTLEGRIVRLSDKIAYINHDMDDAIRAGILCEEDIPKELSKVLGSTRKARLDFLVKNIIENSTDTGDIIMSDEAFEAMVDLRQFMFDNLYHNPTCKSEETKAESMVITLYDYYLEHPEKLPDDIQKLMSDKNVKPQRAVCDYISGMTDYYCVAVFTELFVPEFWGK
ncbi:MAG: deoxyguanosinetriphosphate triphosphohydrolase [Lachnospiraceae bacterium]|nr:deoxyguanosinetriphosphate triphosphohydrolase [Lachnospiraceae bacterium]